MLRSGPIPAEFRIFAPFLHHGYDSFNKLRTVRSDIDLFAYTRHGIIQLDGFIRPAESNAFMSADPDRLVFALMVFPVSIFA